MVAVGLNTSNHLTGMSDGLRGIVVFLRPPTCRLVFHSLSSYLCLTCVLILSYLRLTYVAMFLAALFLIQAFISPFKRLTESISAAIGLKTVA